MYCTSFKIKDFKNFVDETIDLSPITILVGGNNAGKSSVLQAFHFGVTALQSRAVTRANTFLSSELRYCPTSNFLELKRNGRLTESSGLTLTYYRVDRNLDSDEKCEVHVVRGRNGAVGLSVPSGDNHTLWRDLASLENPYSIYVPGLSGLPLHEEYRSELVVNNGIARGDANLYLRNVLLRIKQDGNKNTEFHKLLNQVFPGLQISTTFNEKDDLHINSIAASNDGSEKPIDLLGTGALQAIQLLAYVVKYRPSTLLLDEPDAHLHPNNQRTICEVLRIISEETNVQVIAATHSRHFVDEFLNGRNSNVIWLKNNKVQRDKSKSQIAILTDLGALDEGERILHQDCRALVWTEDGTSRKASKYLKQLLGSNGFRDEEYAILSYKTSNRIEGALMISNFIHEAYPQIHIVIHRDQDFMTDDEMMNFRDLYARKGVFDGNVHMFFTKGCDIEHMFTQQDHIGHVISNHFPNLDVEELLTQAIYTRSVEISRDFTRKRDEIKKSIIYRGREDDCPSVDELLTDENLDRSHCVGKTLIKKVNGLINDRGINPSQLINASPALAIPELQEIADNIWGGE